MSEIPLWVSGKKNIYVCLSCLVFICMQWWENWSRVSNMYGYLCVGFSAGKGVCEYVCGCELYSSYSVCRGLTHSPGASGLFMPPVDAPPAPPPRPLNAGMLSLL